MYDKIHHKLKKKIKIKKKIKAAREKQQITHKGIPIRITADLSIETLQARRERQDILKVMKENNLQPKLLHSARISFRYEGEFKRFTEKQKLRQFSLTKPALQQMLKDLLKTGNTKLLYECKHKTTKQMAIGPFLLIITLNVILFYFILFVVNFVIH